MRRLSQLRLAVLCGCLVAVSLASAQAVIPVDFDSGRSQAFVVAGSGSAISVGVAGVDLGSARLGKAALKPKAIDTVSRIVVFAAPGGTSYELADTVKVGQQLKASSGPLVVEDWVEQVGGRYLPFSLLKLRHSGAAPGVGEPLLDASGRVAAIGYEPAGAGKIYALPVNVVRRTLSGARSGNMERAWLGLVLDPKVQAPRVVRIVEGSPAAAIGLVKGDLLLELNGRPLADYGDAVHAFFLLQIGEETSLRYRRGSEVISTSVTPRRPRR